MAAAAGASVAQQNLAAVVNEVFVLGAQGRAPNADLMTRLMAAQAAVNAELNAQIAQNTAAMNMLGGFRTALDNETARVEERDAQMERARQRALERVRAVDARYNSEVGVGAAVGAVVGAAAGVGVLAVATLATGGTALAATPAIFAGVCGGLAGGGAGGYSSHTSNRREHSDAVAAARDLERR